jgi:hypothetical protein
MSSARPRLAAVLIAAMLLSLALGAQSSSAATSKSARASLRSLVRQTNALPAAAASPAKLRQLKRAARRARAAARRRPCTAVRSLTRYRRVLRTAKPRGRLRASRRSVLRIRLARLQTSSVSASRRLLTNRNTRRCGGGAAPTRLSSTEMKVLSSTENGMRVRVKLPNLRFVPRSGGGRAWTQLVLPNTDQPGKPGKPGIPVASSTLGVPDGAKLAIKAASTDSYTVGGIDVFPAQPDPVDQAPRARPDFDKAPFATKPFTIDNAAYRDDGLKPAPAGGGVLGTVRDVTLGGLQIPAAQYDPVAKKLKVLTSVVVTITFRGGPHTFSDELGSPWEQAQRRLIAGLLNAGVVRSKRPFIFRRCGEEMLVITNPATRAAADQLAVGRRAAGIRTTVVETGTGAGQIGTTAAAIQTFIRGRLNTFLCIRPSYVTIMGDDDLVPTFAGINGIPSDLQYSMRNDADELPDLAVGRIIGNDQTEVGRAVTKILGYETTSPTGAFLTRATVAAQFQDDDNDGTENRTFILFAETVRNGLARRGVAVDRIYGEHPGNNPQKLNDGTDLPAALKKPTFAWNGSGAQVSAAWNQGRFMMVHRDHGWSDGWGTPGYGTADVNALTNGANLPVLLSINCSSGAYDYDETSFAGQALVKANGGAVGVFGDTRDSPTWHNTQIALGFVDGLLPSVLPSEGPAVKQRTGDALITGKLRLAGLAPPTSDGSTRNELYLWHYFGDPTMQMWGGGSPPVVFDLSRFRAVYKPSAPGDPGPYNVQVTLPAELAGQPVSLLRNGEVVGKALAGAGSVTIPAAFGDGSVKPGELRIAMDPDGAQPVNAPVEGVPPAPTQLTQSCPASVPFDAQGTAITVTGTLPGPPAGSAVAVTFQAPPNLQGAPGRTVVQNVVTDAQGAWAATVTTTDPAEVGDWTVSSAFAGTSSFGASRAGPCTIPVTNNTG